MVKQPKKSFRYLRSWLWLIIPLMLGTLACGFLIRESERTSGSIVMLTRLPTFTRTPLPPLALTTPTNASVAVVAEATSGLVDAVTPLPGPTLSAPEVTPNLIEPEPGITVAQVPSTSANTPDPLATATALPVLSATVPTNDPLSINMPTGEPAPPTIPLPSGTAFPTSVIVTQAASSTETPTLSPTGIPTATPTAASVPQAWAFSNIQVYTDQYEGGLLLYGNVTNSTGTPQELFSIGGDFYDAQGQVIAGPEDSFSYWPGFVLPAGGSMPFELVVDEANSPANFELTTEAEPSNETPRQDFDFAEVNQWTEDETYCISGKLRNPVGALDEYLVIAMILYDAEEKVINFSDYGEFGSGIGEDGQDFEICIDPPNHGVARYELRAWGR